MKMRGQHYILNISQVALVKDLWRGLVNKCVEPVGKRDQSISMFAKENTLCRL